MRLTPCEELGRREGGFTVGLLRSYRLDVLCPLAALLMVLALIVALIVSDPVVWDFK